MVAKLGPCLALLLLASGASVPASAQSAPPPIYNLGTLGGPSSNAGGINNSGQVVGYSRPNPTADLEDHVFLYTGTPGVDGRMIDLGKPGPGNAFPYAVNERGQVAGLGGSGAFLYTGPPGAGVMHNLGSLNPARPSESSAWGINASGHVVGEAYYERVNNVVYYQPFLYTGTPGVDGVMHALGSLGGTYAGAADINDSGWIVGGATTRNDVGTHAFLYTGTPGADGRMIDLGTLGGDHGGATAVNARGQITGNSMTPGDAVLHPFLYTGTPGVDGRMIDLGTLNGLSMSPNDINDRGQIVGHSALPASPWSVAFAYTGTPGVDGRMIDLDAWLDANNPAEGAKWTLWTADGVNNNGLITGTGMYDDGPGGLSDGARAYLLDASSLLVPEPTGLALLPLAAPALFRRRRARAEGRNSPTA